MDTRSNEDASESVPPIVTELRALEWELSEAIRRLEVLRDSVRRLQLGESEAAAEGEVERGTL
jgi:hypothetical protein